MEYTGIGKEKEEFVPRKGKEEFFRDGEVVKELYCRTDALICEERNVPFHNYTLCVFNHAYYICWKFLHESVLVNRIGKTVIFENRMVEKFSWVVAYALLRLHEKFYPIEHGDYVSLFSKFPCELYERHYNPLAQGMSLSKPLSFCVPLPGQEMNFSKARSYVTAALGEGARLQEENKELRKRLEAEEKLRKKAEWEMKALQQKLDAWENNAFYKAVNIETIFEYAQSKRCSENNREAIRNTLLYLCSNKVDDDVIDKIRNLELGGNVTIGTQINNNCQQFSGPIINSEFQK